MTVECLQIRKRSWGAPARRSRIAETNRGDRSMCCSITGAAYGELNAESVSPRAV